MPAASRPRQPTSASGSGRPSWGRRRARGFLLPEPPPAGQVLNDTAGAVVAAAKVGRLLGRAGWRLARQVPGVAAVETAVGSTAQRLGSAAAQELLRMLDIPQQLVTGGNPEERRVMMLIQDGGTDPEPLRSAMSELLQRSSGSDTRQDKEYLFGTIISQLVPDEARILATLSGGRRFAVLDVLAKQVGRSSTRTLLANASTVGAAARVALPDNVPTYLSRLQSFGLVEFSPTVDGMDGQFAALNDDPAVRAARSEADGKFGSAKVARKSVMLSALGREFWSAAAPAPTDLDRLSG
jgi:hypothetical protein